MRVLIYFDPISTYSWVAYQWLNSISEEKKLKIELCPFSLAIKNHVIDKAEMSDEDYEVLTSQRILRVMLAAKKIEGANLEKLYAIAGKRFHEKGKPYDDRSAEIMLRAAKLPLSLIETAESYSYDEQIQESMNEAMGIVGKNVRVPIIIVDDKRFLKQPRGFFGPILKDIPNREDGLLLWESFFNLLPLEVYELYRTYPESSDIPK